MPDYEVEWATDVDAATPREAAQIALDVILSEDSHGLSRVFIVRLKGAEDFPMTVDLSPGPRTYTATITPEAAASLATSTHPDTAALDKIERERPTLDADTTDADLAEWVRRTILPVLAQTGRL
jgi:hypothetical protein